MSKGQEFLITSSICKLYDELDVSALTIDIETKEQLTTAAKSEKWIIIVLDNSGSMETILERQTILRQKAILQLGDLLEIAIVDCNTVQIVVTTRLRRNLQYNLHRQDAVPSDRKVLRLGAADCIGDCIYSSGSALNQAKQAINALVKVVRVDNNSMEKISLITYNSNATLWPLADQSYQGIVNTVNSINASGGTSFTNAFYKINSTLTDISAVPKGMSEVVVIFFTDGQDVDSVQNRKTAMTSMKTTLEKFTSTIHTIGFSADHDARLLSEITTLGTTQGSFQYVKESSQIVTAIESIGQLIVSSQNNLAAKLILDRGKEGKEEKKVFLNATNVGFTGTAYLYLPLSVISSCKIKLILSSGKNTRVESTLEPTTSEAVPMATTLRLTCDYITQRVIELSRTTFAVNASKDTLWQTKDEVALYDKILADAGQKIHKIRNRDQRKEMFGYIEDASLLISEFHKMLSSGMAQSLISNDKIASLNSMAYKNITKRGLRKALDQRVEQNALMFENMEKMIDQAVEAMNFDELNKKYGEKAEELGTCALSCMNWIEALKERDCLCLTVNITRSQAAIADPSQCVINSIGQTFVTAESFLDSVQFALNANAEAHGGFQKNAESKIVTGNAREAISGVLPLYITKEHWGVAKHKMKPILGWMATLDVLGYGFAQMKIIPFMILAVAGREATRSEFKKKQFDMIFKTCVQIYKGASKPQIEEENRLSTEIKNIMAKYFDDPSVRTVDTIPSNAAFIGHLLCATFLGDVEPMTEAKLKEFFSLIAEEEMRRRQGWASKNLTDPEIQKMLYQMMDIQSLEEEYIAPQVKEFSTELTKTTFQKLTRVNEFYEKKLKLILEETGEVFDEGQDTIADCMNITVIVPDEAKKLDLVHTPPSKYDGSLSKCPTELDKLIQETKELFDNVAVPLLQLKPLFGGSTRQIDTLEAIGITTLEQVAALAIQNLVQAKNSDRKQAIDTKTYWSPFTQAKEILKYHFCNVVQSEKEKKMRESLNGCLAQINSLVQSYVAKFQAFERQKSMGWEMKCLKYLEWMQLHPLKPLNHKEPICQECSHVKPNYKGFRCVCGCMHCYTSAYFKQDD